MFEANHSSISSVVLDRLAALALLHGINNSEDRRRSRDVELDGLLDIILGHFLVRRLAMGP
jgi:hypothetical protein